MQKTTEETPDQAPFDVASYAGRLSLLACSPDGLRAVALGTERDVVIGRDASCQLSLANPALSRFHARFSQRGAQVAVEDLGSRHGTWLAGQRVARAELELGASVRLANVVVTLTCMTASATAHDQALLPDALYLSQRARAARALLQRVAPAQVPVLLHGETGTGKELAARELHLASGRGGPLRVLNCAAIPPLLIESTLFGHERGAFTGAERARAGAFEDAHGGTLLLDEVGELSLAAQAALLRVLETRRLTRVGSNRELEVDVRIVSATHRDLQAMAARGQFRTDLLHRLWVVSIELPPLRERREEIAALARMLLAQQGGPLDIDPAALSCLESYQWPGNIRELRNVLARAGALAQGPCITSGDLPDAVRARVPGSERPRSAAALAAPPSSRTLRERLKNVEHGEVRRALEQSEGNQRRAAALLGIPLRTFERRLQALREASSGQLLAGATGLGVAGKQAE